MNIAIDKARLVIVSGRSGSGKTSALHVLEDLGYLCIDNLPVTLIDQVVTHLLASESEVKRALGVDVRSPGSDLSEFPQVLEALSVNELSSQLKPVVLFLDADDETLFTRFSATRRQHPLLKTHPGLASALASETELLRPVSAQATLMLDTGRLNVHELKTQILFALGQTAELGVTFESFGFKRGVPLDADYVFDVRMLTNPYWYPELRALTGQDAEIAEFFAADEQMSRMIKSLSEFLAQWLAPIAQSARQRITVAIGCTGGRHRSVYIAEQLAVAFKADYETQVLHRDAKHWS